MNVDALDKGRNDAPDISDENMFMVENLGVWSKKVWMEIFKSPLKRIPNALLVVRHSLTSYQVIFTAFKNSK